jgi:hypothetical protein
LVPININFTFSKLNCQKSMKTLGEKIAGLE